MCSGRSTLSSMYINELERKINNALAHLAYETNLFKVRKTRTDCKPTEKPHSTDGQQSDGK